MLHVFGSAWWFFFLLICLNRMRKHCFSYDYFDIVTGAPFIKYLVPVWKREKQRKEWKIASKKSVRVIVICISKHTNRCKQTADNSACLPTFRIISYFSIISFCRKILYFFFFSFNGPFYYEESEHKRKCNEWMNERTKEINKENKNNENRKLFPKAKVIKWWEHCPNYKETKN